MNVLLINPNNDFNARVKSAPLGLLSIASYLKERGYHVRIYDRNVEKASLEKVAAACKPDAVGISVPSFRHIRDSIAVAHWLRKKEIPVVWGGHVAFALPELILREGCANYVVPGEGEITFHELLQAMEKKDGITQIRGIVYQDESGAICRTPEREFADLADFPPIDWSFVDPRAYFAPHVYCSKMIYLFSSKGCPGRCAFCINKAYHQCKYRKRPNRYVISEIKELVANCGLEGVQFADEMFGANKDDLYDLCGQLRDINIVWGCQTRAGHFKREDLQRMYDAGCRWIFYGVESGSQEMLDRLHKGIDLAAIDQEFMYCREIGIATMGSFIIGFPDETREQLRETVRFILRLNANVCQLSFFGAIPGSELYNHLVESGQFTPYQTLREWREFYIFLGKISANYSNVPTRDLYVVQSFFLWRTFFHTKLPKGSVWYKYLLGMVLALFKNFFAQGILDTLRYLFSPVGLFLKTAWYAHAFPGIRKKYGLSRNQITRKRN